jgi:predicted nucleic acid-binding protein
MKTRSTINEECAMSGIRVLCDTNTLIHLLNGNRDVAAFLTGKSISISVITELELYGKQNLSKRELSIIDVLVENCFVVDLLHPVKQIVKELKQKYKIKLPDAIVAATALYLDVPFVTFDTDFKNITGLKLVLFNLQESTCSTPSNSNPC